MSSKYQIKKLLTRCIGKFEYKHMVAGLFMKVLCMEVICLGGYVRLRPKASLLYNNAL